LKINSLSKLALPAMPSNCLVFSNLELQSISKEKLGTPIIYQNINEAHEADKTAAKIIIDGHNIESLTHGTKVLEIS
jgi:hypothetical protein